MGVLEKKKKNFARIYRYNSEAQTQADRAVGRLSWMLGSCSKLAKMYHGKIFKENS
jgi:hypothetical protein